MNLQRWHLGIAEAISQSSRRVLHMLRRGRSQHKAVRVEAVKKALHTQLLTLMHFEKPKPAGSPFVMRTHSLPRSAAMTLRHPDVASWAGWSLDTPLASLNLHGRQHRTTKWPSLLY